MGWSLSTDQIALRIAGANDAGSPWVRPTSDIVVSAQYQRELGTYTASSLVSSSESWRTSPTTPTIVDHGLPSCPRPQRKQTRRPIGFCPGSFRLAKDALMT